ncbi:MAG: hypothetical protein DME26_02915 [Verrucomicrobia bacterium]|nr:MAG: hypothetical protein DME26_02915 [Verrucomicrobiota bacterium]
MHELKLGGRRSAGKSKCAQQFSFFPERGCVVPASRSTSRLHQEVLRTQPRSTKRELLKCASDNGALSALKIGKFALTVFDREGVFGASVTKGPARAICAKRHTLVSQSSRE